MNYSDFSTLQYLPANKAFLAYNKAKQEMKYSIKLTSYEPTAQEQSSFNEPTYVLSKNKWHLFYYEPGKQRVDISVDMLSSLQVALNKLPKGIPPEQLTAAEIKPIKTVIATFHSGAGGYLGIGNGWEITRSINIYLLHFF